MTLEEAQRALYLAGFEEVTLCGLSEDEDCEEGELFIDPDAKEKLGIQGYYRYIEDEDDWQGHFFICIANRTDGLSQVTLGVGDLGEVVDGLTLSEAVDLVSRRCKPGAVLN